MSKEQALPILPHHEALQLIVDLSAGWDDEGSTGPRPPLSWESVGRVAMDYARAALASPAAEPVQAVAWIEEFARQWDGCIHDAGPGGDIDIGGAIRSEWGKYLAFASHPATKKAKAGPACAECGDTGYVRDATGDGPWNCPRCGRRDEGLCRSCSSTGACTAGSECVACSNQSYGAHARAADMLTAYAELIKATGRYAEEYYIPEVEQVVEQLRARPEGAA